MTFRAASAIIALAISMGLLWSSPAAAQFGTLFDPPRPPGNVPTQPPVPPPQALPPPSNLLPPGPPPGRIQSEDLPPPGGPTFQPAALPRAGVTAAVPPPAAAPAGSGPAPAARPQRAGVPAATPGNNSGNNSAIAAAPAAAPPPEDVVTQPPTVKIVNPTAVFAGLDKITGRITAFDAAIGETVQFGALQVTARACYSRPPTETQLTDGFIEVDEVTLQGEVRRIFTGWMFAASPGLHAVEHPIYDVWLTDCKGGAPAVADAQPASAASSAPSRPTPPAQRQAPQRATSQGAQPPAALRGNLPPSGTLAQPGPR